MSGLGNKAIFSKNLQKYIQLSGKTRSEICQDLKFSYSTFSEWVNGAKYPRIDKIEMLANYFGIKKSDLIEEDHSEKTKTPPALTKKDERDIEKILAAAREQLENQEGLMFGKDEVTGSNPVISSKKRPVTVVVAGLFHVFYNFSISPKMTKNRAKNERKTLNCSQIAVKSEWGHIVRICCHIISRLGDYLTTAW